VICPSHFAAKELIELLGVSPSKIHIIPHGLNVEYSDPDPASDEVLSKLGIRPPFLIHAAGATERKNLDGLAEAWRYLSNRVFDLSLVLFGPTDSRRDEAFDGLIRVTKPGYVAPSVLAGVMARAEVVVVPSTYEGFGLPALEGMACGVPVVAASAGALPEVCGDAALLVEPKGVNIAEGVTRILTDQQLAGALRKRGPIRAANFSWSTAANQHLAVYRDVMAA
jgi:glycosyltransferase involved in cell wall biosynthesis